MLPSLASDVSGLGSTVPGNNSQVVTYQTPSLFDFMSPDGPEDDATDMKTKLKWIRRIPVTKKKHLHAKKTIANERAVAYSRTPCDPKHTTMIGTAVIVHQSDFARFNCTFNHRPLFTIPENLTLRYMDLHRTDNIDAYAARESVPLLWRRPRGCFTANACWCVSPDNNLRPVH